MRSLVLRTLRLASLAFVCATLQPLTYASDACAQQTRTATQSCCVYCRKGKACGNSCISRYKQCHKGPGCACDASTPEPGNLAAIPVSVAAWASRLTATMDRFTQIEVSE